MEPQKNVSLPGSGVEALAVLCTCVQLVPAAGNLFGDRTAKTAENMS